ncbi:MAG: Sec-independent protein translocase protein TatB [Alphaproteobacteria bacterium]|jgi:sec-independent protein translocase protein TatB|nr:Sec-independent protein translocase protein TatB [Alphaproteobacteria bacterium]
MIDIAWSECLFIALIALILIGPKELPTLLRYIGKWVGKVRIFAKEFTSQLDLEAHMEEKDVQKVPLDKELPPSQPPKDQEI